MLGKGKPLKDTPELTELSVEKYLKKFREFFEFTFWKILSAYISKQIIVNCFGIKLPFKKCFENNLCCFINSN